MRDALWQDVCCSALLPVIVPLCEQQAFTGNLAVTQACYLLSALFCTAALISEGCTLVGSVLHDAVASHCAGSKSSNSAFSDPTVSLVAGVHQLPAGFPMGCILKMLLSVIMVSCQHTVSVLWAAMPNAREQTQLLARHHDHRQQHFQNASQCQIWSLCISVLLSALAQPWA